MKKFIKKILCFGLLTGLSILTACKKEDAFLSKKSNASLAVPSTLSDFELLLNNEVLFNGYSSPALGTMSCDDYFVTNDAWISAGTPVEQNAYIFAKDIYHSSKANDDWNIPYQQIYYCNVVLDGLAKLTISPDQQAKYDMLKGDALFLRAYAFYNLIQTFAMPYDTSTSQTDPGIPLVTSSDINKRYGRGSVKAAYDQIISDVTAAAAILPPDLTSVTKACKISCQAFLARVYLAMANYPQAFSSADKCLSAYDYLVDYNNITPERYTIGTQYLKEDIFHTSLINYDLTINAWVDSTLYKSYDGNDLRKVDFFRISAVDGRPIFRGTYDVYWGNWFSGLATDEIYLIRSECNARAGKLTDALNDLNKLLVNRYKAGTFTPISSSDPEKVLTMILSEREKELYLRGLRWTDLRRLNKEERFKKTVVHTINGVAYKLSPNDPRYAMPIPDQEIQLTGIPQNIR